MKKIIVSFFIILSTLIYGKENAKAPEFSGKGIDGIVHTLEDYKGKVIFLNFWATWCPPCREEMPDIEKIYKEYGSNKKDVVILGVSNESKEKVENFLKEEGYTFPTIIDKKNEIGEKYYVYAYPTTYIINKKGELYGHAIGAISEESMKNAIEGALEK